MPAKRSSQRVPSGRQLPQPSWLWIMENTAPRTISIIGRVWSPCADFSRQPAQTVRDHHHTFYLSLNPIHTTLASILLRSPSLPMLSMERICIEVLCLRCTMCAVSKGGSQCGLTCGATGEDSEALVCLPPLGCCPQCIGLHAQQLNQSGVFDGNPDRFRMGYRTPLYTATLKPPFIYTLASWP